MKKSEMIQILADQFLMRGMASKNGSFVAAEEMLELIEKVGMLPPPLMSGGEEPNQAYFNNEWELEEKGLFEINNTEYEKWKESK